MSGPHERVAASARRAIERHGRAMTRVRREHTAGVPFDPSSGTTTETLLDFVALHEPFSASEQFAAAESGGRLDPAHDRRYLVAGDVPIGVGDRIRDGGVDYAVTGIDPIEPGTTRIVQRVRAEL